MASLSGLRAAVGGWRTAQIYAATQSAERLRHDPAIQRALRTLYFQHASNVNHASNMTRLPLTGSTRLSGCGYAGTGHTVVSGRFYPELKTPDGRRRLADIADTLFRQIISLKIARMVKTTLKVRNAAKFAQPV